MSWKLEPQGPSAVTPDYPSDHDYIAAVGSAQDGGFNEDDPDLPQDYDEMVIFLELVFGDHPELQTLGDIKAAWARKRDEIRVPEIDERDLGIEVIREAMYHGKWWMTITHAPTGIKVSADSDTHRSQLQAKVALLHELGQKLKEHS